MAEPSQPAQHAGPVRLSPLFGTILGMPDDVDPVRLKAAATRRPTSVAAAYRRPAVSRSLAAVRPYLAAEWHRTRNDELTPHDVTVRKGLLHGQD